MRALLDTNIVIHRENKRASNYSVGHLYRWLDRLKYDKVIHPYSISEIEKYKDSEAQEALEVKLNSYNVIRTVIDPPENFLQLIGIPEKTENDIGHISKDVKPHMLISWDSLKNTIFPKVSMTLV